MTPMPSGVYEDNEGLRVPDKVFDARFPSGALLA